MTPACIAPQLKAIRYSTGIWNFGNDGYIRQEAAHVSTADAASDPAGADGRPPPFRDDDQQRIPAHFTLTQTHSTPQTPRFTFPDEAAGAATLLWNPENTYCTTVVYTRAGSPFSPLPSHATPGHPHPIPHLYLPSPPTSPRTPAPLVVARVARGPRPPPTGEVGSGTLPPTVRREEERIRRGGAHRRQDVDMGGNGAALGGG